MDEALSGVATHITVWVANGHPPTQAAMQRANREAAASVRPDLTAPGAVLDARVEGRSRSAAPISPANLAALLAMAPPPSACTEAGETVTEAVVAVPAGTFTALL